MRALGRIGHPSAVPALDRAEAQQFWIPGMAAMVADARSRIETASGVALPSPRPHEIVPAGDTIRALDPGKEPKLPLMLNDLSSMRRKFRTPFGRAFYLKAAESWDPTTLGVVCQLTDDAAYAVKALSGPGATKPGETAGRGGDRTALEVNDVTGFDEAWCAAAFPTVPDEWKPGVLWKWNESAGVTNMASTANVFAHLAAPSDLARAFINYPLSADGESWRVEPVHPSKSLPLTWKAPKYGYHCFRSGWRGKDDFVAQVFARERAVKGRSRADAGAFRLFGLGHPWVVGPAGRTGFRAQEPCVVLPDDEYNERGYGRVTHLETEPGDGSGAMTVDLSDVYGKSVGGVRAFAIDYSGKCGVPAMMVVVDRITGGGKRLWLWQLPKGKLDEVQIDGNSFSIRYPDASMKATFVTPIDVKIEATRDRVRAGRLGGPNGLFEGRLDRVKATAPAGKSFFVVVTFQRGTPPKVEVKGDGLDAKVCIGKRTVRFGDDKIELK